MGATPAVVSLRLDQAVAELPMAAQGTAMISYAECSARERLAQLLDAGSFHEWLPPAERLTSPHLAQLGVPSSFDDGVAIGRAHAGAAARSSSPPRKASFMGGGVGEVHGAKLVGLLRRALRDRPGAVLLLAESGGVRLHEANAGLIAVSEVMRALLDVRAAGIPVVVLIGGANGCFGGMGIVARCADHIVMSDVGRLAMSGPEVIEASHGVEEFDSRDRALVWRTTGGKHRWLTRRLRRAGRRRRRRVPRRGRSRRSMRSKPLTLQSLRGRARPAAARLRPLAKDAATTPSRCGAPGHRRRRRACRTWTSTRCARCGTAEERIDGMERLATRLFGTDHGIAPTATSCRARAIFDGRADRRGRHHEPRADRRAAGAGARRAWCSTRSRSIRAAPILLLIDTQGQQLRRRDELLGHQPRDGAPGLLHRPGAAARPSRDRPGVRPGPVGRLHHLGPDRRRLRRAARGRDPRHAHSRDGARDQAARGHAHRLVAIQPGVRAGGAELLRDGRRARAVAGRPAGRPARGAGACRDRRPRAIDGRERGGRLLAAAVVQRVLAA